MHNLLTKSLLTCSSKERSGSRVMQRSFTVLFETTVQPLGLIVRFNRWSLCFLGPRTSISVLSEFKSRKFAAIHFLMSETYASSEGNFGASPCFHHVSPWNVQLCVIRIAVKVNIMFSNDKPQEVKYIVKTIVDLKQGHAYYWYHLKGNTLKFVEMWN